MGEVCGDVGSSQGSQSLNDSVQSEERLIDSLSEVVSTRELTNGDNAGTANVDSPGVVRRDSASGITRKRVRGSESPGDGCGSGPRKRYSIHVDFGVTVGGGLAVVVDDVGSRSVGAAGDGPSAGGGGTAEGGRSSPSSTLRYVSDASSTSVGGSTLTDAGAVLAAGSVSRLCSKLQALFVANNWESC